MVKFEVFKNGKYLGYIHFKPNEKWFMEQDIADRVKRGFQVVRI